jgi:hypothetical protein
MKATGKFTHAFARTRGRIGWIVDFTSRLPQIAIGLLRHCELSEANPSRRDRRVNDGRT